MNASLRRHARPRGFRGRLVIAAALGALALPGSAQAHPAGSVIALDYEAVPSAHEAVAPGVHARVLDGDRRLQLHVGSGHEVTVMGYGGEPFLRFSPRGVQVNERSLTSVTNRLARAGAVPALSAAARPEWALVTGGERFAWHDHRLGPRPGEPTRAGVVGTWSIPVVVDGMREQITGRLRHARRPAVLPWIGLWCLALGYGAAVARRARGPSRRVVPYVCTAVSGALVLVVGAGFTLGSAESAPYRWIGLAVPLALASIPVAVFLRSPPSRFVVVTLTAALVFADALQNVSVFWHGYVVSSLPAGLVRLALATALAGGAVALVVVLTDLFGETRDRRRPQPRPRPRSQPKLAIPKGKVR